MNTMKHLVKSFLGRIFEIEDKREDELMIDKAEDDSRKSLHILCERIPAVEFNPIDQTPVDAYQPLVFNLNSIDFGSKSNEEGNSNDEDVDNDRDHSENRYLLQYAQILLEDKDQIEERGKDNDANPNHFT
jgi:hypothetical protein